MSLWFSNQEKGVCYSPWFLTEILPSVCLYTGIFGCFIHFYPTTLTPDVSGRRGVGWTFQSRSSSALRGMTLVTWFESILVKNQLSEMRAVHLTKLSKLAFEWHYCLSNLIYNGLEVEKRNRLGDYVLALKGVESQDVLGNQFNYLLPRSIFLLCL